MECLSPRLQSDSKSTSLIVKLSLNSSGVALPREVQRALMWVAKCLDCTFITSLEIKIFLWLAEPFVSVVWEDFQRLKDFTLCVSSLCAVLV